MIRCGAIQTWAIRKRNASLNAPDSVVRRHGASNFVRAENQVQLVVEIQIYKDDNLYSNSIGLKALC